MARRSYIVLALESSCDDSCVALLDKFSPVKPPRIIDHFKKTLNSADLGGIVPTEAYKYHMSTISKLTNELLLKHNLNSKNPPDLICVTRGPGMSGSLSSSTEFAKGLSVAWNVPLVGVHHMLGHLLTAFLSKSNQPKLGPPNYPFLSLLCSGGHTMLVLSKSLIDHEIIINTNDIAVGDSLDKCARELGLYGNMLGKELEMFIDNFTPEEKEEFGHIDVDSKVSNKYNFTIKLPYLTPKHGQHGNNLKFSFAQFLSNILGYKKENKIDETTRKFIAFKTQEFIFDHMVDRINKSFKLHGNEFKSDGKFIGVKDFVCSGGVAANQTLRNKLSNNLKGDLIDTESLTFHFPDLALCTDNAVMIGLAGIEIFEKLKLKTDLSFTPIRKWPINELLKADGWIKVEDEEINRVNRVNTVCK
ncbi:unnamed protein product [Candida verbasci]|uniref:N(6)-L-threonylcarbamoyladenine synthase n=1 Tax=Candida verbasci TaxID=1227364 RepID=A0A9W4XBJ8_9ASCO|nr:unnamed protein product [Candida verbasci]